MITVNQLFKNKRKNPKYKLKLRALEWAPQRRGIIYKVTIMTPRKPNSAKRKIAKVRLVFNNFRIFAAIPGIGHNLHEYSSVMLRGGSAKDLPGVNYTLIKGMLDFSSLENFSRQRRRSKFGINKLQAQNKEQF